jgi:hypothetical protein
MLATALVLMALVAACRSNSPTVSAEGVVLSVAASSMVSVNSFELREADGQILTFVVGPLDAGSFPAEHLRTHLQSAIPIIVTYQQNGNELVVLHMVDAVSASPTA